MTVPPTPAPADGPDHRGTETSSTGGRLRAAIEASHRRHTDQPTPEFSLDAGGTVSDHHGRSARWQPLGERTRITLVDRERMVAEAEIDSEELIARVGSEPGAPYAVVAAMVDTENGNDVHDL